VRLSIKDSNAVLSHNNEQLLWDIKSFEINRQTPANLGYGEIGIRDADLFNEINRYWEYLPRQKQDEIFAIYKEINQTFEDSMSFEDLIYSLRPLIEKLLSYHSHKDVAYWVKMKSDIRIPSDAKVYPTMEDNMKASEQYGSREWPRESTYLEEDYWGLIFLVVTLRCMFPVWGRFMDVAKRTVDNNLKELYSLRLLTKSTIEKLDDYKRLLAYINHYIPSDRLDRGVVAGYVSSEDFVPWITGNVVVRRLSLVTVNGRNNKFSLVASIWGFITQLMRQYDKTVSETIKDKNPEGNTRDNDRDNKASNLELIKIKEPITSGDVVMLNEYCRNVEHISYLLSGEHLPQLLQTTMTSVQRLRNSILRDPQIVLLQWVVAKEVQGNPKELDSTEFDMECVFPPRGVEYLEKEQILSLMAAATTALWHRGYYDLAALLSANVMENRDVAQGGAFESPLALTKENREKLIELFPHVPRPSGKQQQYENQRPSKKPCEAVDAIDELWQMLIKYNWVLTLPAQMAQAIPGHQGGRRYSVPADIRNRLAQLIIALATRSF